MLVRGRQPSWSAAVSPRSAPAGDLQVARVDGATITPFARGPLRSSQGPRSWMTGAVHDADGLLVPESQRVWDGDRVAPVSADPHRRRRKVTHELAGVWVYAGHWTNHFGHFFVETMANLWPDPARLAGPEGIAGIIAHRSYRGAMGRRAGPLLEPELSTWQQSLLELAGFGGLPLKVVRRGTVSVETLPVPARPVVLKSWAHPRAVEAWRRIAAGVTPGTETRVFLSRRMFHMTRPGEEDRVRVPAEWDLRLEQLAQEAGYAVVHPETLSVPEQVRIVRGAEVLAGPSGSALHLSALARPGTRVLEIGDSRSPTQPMPTQRMIDAACAHRTAFAPYRDVRAVRRALRSG